MTCFWDDNFTGVNGSPPDITKWTDISTGAGSVQIFGNKLRISNGATGVAGLGGVQSLAVVSGDFDVQVKFNNSVNPSTNTWGTNLRFRIDATHFITVGESYQTSSGGKIYFEQYNGGSKYVFRSFEAGWLRIVRTGSNCDVYYCDGDSFFIWSHLGIQIVTGSGDGVISLLVYKTNALPNAVVDFDLFQFNVGCPASVPFAVPTVVTSSVTDITSSSAVANGQVVDAGGGNISQRGFVWSTSVNPTTSDNKIVVSGTTGDYSGDITGLDRITTYHVRAYAINEIGTGYGADVQFDTLAELPTVTTSDATAIAATSATGHGNVTDAGGVAITERGFVWSLLVNPTTADSKLIVSGTTGLFSVSITGLTTGATYYYRAYATNSIGTAYGADYTISTIFASPTVTTSAVTDIGSSAATANGEVVDAGGGTILERGFAWGTAPNPTVTADNKLVVSGTIGVFSGTLAGLTSNVLYHVRAYAINEAGIAYGADVFFTSLESGMGGGGGGGAGGAEPVAVGTVYSPDDEAGVVYAVDVTTGNLLLFYKKIDPLPYSVTDSARWNDGFDLPYTASALALALSAEDDEYDRYRAWIYEFISNSVADSLRNMAINKNVR